MKRLKEIKDLVQEAIDSGARNVEEIHRCLAAKPFKVLKKIRVSGSAVERLEDFQGQTIGNVYEFIRSLNEKIGEIATELLKKMEGDREAGKGKRKAEKVEVSAPDRCMATTKKGTRCKRKPRAGSRFCGIHQPK
ncbi:MAG: hypothetical protein JRJ09_16085 [Deltaproteobacteria bacterium]|nr:hypothetical protein [Deltaproteobacteria bacterium]MBW2050028.1 hypothetical protein [Deltaproteobacteria bacterium]MBW2111820.1 hypothetical protein [Deltaproteobacteria bacterium]MBW2354702.1 hypothetical protein [Deltaproteobacteria bacterium]HDZ91934.1 hypothetical protein [Deltaproteobacteria bacterium]